MMKQRCYNPKCPNYKNYGARGIRVCEEWMNSFRAFEAWAYANGYKKGLSLDRHPDNDGNYEPNNCRWASNEQQHRNKRTNTLMTAFGETMTVADWADDPRCVVQRHVLYDRRRMGLPAEIAITTPVIDVHTRGLGWDGLGNPNSAHLSAFGETKTYLQWEVDPRCLVSRSSLRERIKQGMSPELAITSRPRKWDRWNGLHVST